MRPLARTSFEDVRASLWFAPSVAAVAALLAAFALSTVSPAALDRLPWPADAASASTVLQVVATATITVTSLTFSLVVVALQLASQQFSPRLLREFARDWVIQLVLSVLVSTFVYALAVLLTLDPQERTPKLAVLVGFGLGVLSVAALLAFLGHIVKSLRIDTMMVSVHSETVATMRQAYPRLDEAEPPRPDDLVGPDGGAVIASPRSGFVKVVTPARLVELAAAEDVVLWLAVRPGDHVVLGTPLATVVRTDGGPVAAADAERLAGPVLSAVELGFERTSEQDTALGLRQLADIAVKALSPGINDPVTAAHAVGYSADLLVRLQDRRLGPQVHHDGDGTARVVLPDRDHRYYLELACGQIRRYGAHEPTVLVALLRMLRDVAVSVRDQTQAEHVRREARLVVEQVDDRMRPADVEAVRDLAARVEQVLAGDVAGAYADRSGETRSI